MDIAHNIGWVILGLAGLYYGAEWLVRGSAGLALSAGLSSLVVGLTVVAFGTSLPELIVSMQANLQGGKDSGDFALGNVIGSNICNIGLVLAVAAIMTSIHVQPQIIKRELVLLIFASVLFVVMLLADGKIGHIEGLILATGIVAYTYFSISIAKRNPHDPLAAAAEEELEDIGEEENGSNSQLAKNLLLTVAGLIFLGIGSDRLVVGGQFLAEEFGVSTALITLTLIAFGTSLPELATTVIACLKNEAELAAGNAIGSCIFNLLCVAGITSLVKPIERNLIAIEDMMVMTGFAVALFLLMKRKPILERKTGFVLLSAYMVYMAFLFIRG